MTGPAPGSQIGPYEVVSLIGKGGMGEVYRARDTKLGREVAIKVLPEAMTRDPERIARFEREARLLASLNHPNIASVYGFDESNGARFLVMEYVDGQTLSRRLDAGGLPVDEALDIARQIAEALEEAHERGVIHRDLKPGNVMITTAGKVKVLDFGLAKVMTDDPSSVSDANSPTITANFTKPGVVLGTAAYMSPEQARGRAVDKRSDIWSFGVVLYEMLSGISPFHGETVSDSIGAILHKDVDLDGLPPGTPYMVRHVVRRCLARDKSRRYRDISDIRIELLDGTDVAEPTTQDRPASRKRVYPLVCFFLVAVSALVTAWMTRPQLPSPMHLSLEPPAEARILFSGDLAGPPVVSPDGSKVAFSAARDSETRRLWVRAFGDDHPRELRGTDGALYPFWSPDSREVGFFTVREMFRFDLGSETVQRVCAVDQARGGSWAGGGRIVFSRSFRGGLWLVDAKGGVPKELTMVDAALHTSHRWPFVIPGTDQFLFSAVNAKVGKAENNGVYNGSLTSGLPPKRIMRSDYRAEYVEGNLLHVRDGVLLASRLDLHKGELLGGPVVITRNIAPDLSTWHGQFSASSNGVLVFNRRTKNVGVAGGKSSTAYSWVVEGDRVTMFDYNGRATATHAAGLMLNSMSLSPNGRMLALVVVSADGTLDIWIHPTAWVPDNKAPGAKELQATSVMMPEALRLTFLESNEIAPVWSPSSDELAFRWAGNDERPLGIYRKRIGGGTEVLIRDNKGEDDHPSDWTNDGKYLVFVTGHWITTDKNDIWAIRLKDGKEVPLVQSKGADRDPKVSPDGRWLAYTHREAARNEVYVIPFAPAWPEDTRSRKWRVSDDGGRMPRWSREGDELYYITESGILMAVETKTSDDTFSFASPRQLFQAPWDVGRTYDPTPDGKNNPNSFVFLDSSEGRDAPISVLLNWQRLLEAE